MRQRRDLMVVWLGGLLMLSLGLAAPAWAVETLRKSILRPIAETGSLSDAVGSSSSELNSPALFASLTGTGGACTLAVPCTIETGFAQVVAGTTLYLRAGTYDFAVNNGVASGSGWGQTEKVMVYAYPGETVTLKPAELEAFNPTAIILHEQASQRYIEYRDLIFDAANLVNFGASAVQTCSDCDTGGTGAHHIRFLNCTSKNVPDGHGVIWKGGASASNEWIGGRVTNVAWVSGSQDHGFYVQNGGNLIEGAEIDTVENGYAIHMFNDGGDGNIFRKNRIHHTLSGILLNKDANLVADNLIWSLTDGVGIEDGSGGGPTVATNSKIYNNTIYGSIVGIVLKGAGGSTGARVRNNIVQNSSDATTSIVLQGGSVTPTVTHNLLDKALTDEGATSPTLNNNQTSTNALLVDPPTDLRLQAGSPALNAGTTLSEVPDDVVGVSRPQGAAYDIGAYERQ